MTTKTMMTRHIVAAGFLMVPLGMVLAGCHEVAASTTRRRPSFVLALLDVSGTTKNARDSYLQGVSTIMDQLQGGDSFWADQITENSLATSRVGLRLDLPAFNVLSMNADDYNTQLTAQKKKAYAEAESLMNGTTKRTTIMDALLVARKVFHSHRAETASHRVLVIFSDMREASARYVFDRENLTAARIKQIIAREQADRRIPNLEHIQIYVAGAAADRSHDPEQIRQIEAFWQSYFHAAGTELPDEHYSASLLDFGLQGRAQQ